jgi:ATP-dependent Clp protease ATP-binding subunit ClpA
MFERFTGQARRVVALAQDEARMLDHNYIGTEHLLLGLVGEGEGVAAQVLVALRADLNRVRQQVIQLLLDDVLARVAPGEASGKGRLPRRIDIRSRLSKRGQRSHACRMLIGHRIARTFRPRLCRQEERSEAWRRSRL